MSGHYAVRDLVVAGGEGVVPEEVLVLVGMLLLQLNLLFAQHSFVALNQKLFLGRILCLDLLFNLLSPVESPAAFALLRVTV